MIRKLQTNTGNTAFNNQLEDCTTERDYDLPRVDFVSHARGLGANAEKVEHLSDFEAAFERAKASDKTYVIVTDIDDTKWSSCDAWWEVGLSEVTDNENIANARDQWEEGRQHQRRGV